MDIIWLDNIFKNYRRGSLEIPVLGGVSIKIEQDELVALVGASGSGKSTLMNILGCLDRPTAGRYWFEGQEISSLSADERARIRNTKIGFVFQNFNLLPRANALDNVRMPLDYSLEHPSDATCVQRATEMLRLVDLADRMEHSPAELSGGQQQRLAIARSLINRPRVLMADEPTGNLDSHTSEDVLRLLQRLNQEEGLTILIVTHDENVARHAHRIIRIMDGVIVDEGPGRSRQRRRRKKEDPPVQSSQAKSITDGDSTERPTPAAVRHDGMFEARLAHFSNRANFASPQRDAISANVLGNNHRHCRGDRDDGDRQRISTLDRANDC
jgi:ABC-type lipoprotein export system ATPase subunit